MTAKTAMLACALAIALAPAAHAESKTTLDDRLKECLTRLNAIGTLTIEKAYARKIITSDGRSQRRRVLATQIGEIMTSAQSMRTISDEAKRAKGLAGHIENCEGLVEKFKHQASFLK